MVQRISLRYADSVGLAKLCIQHRLFVAGWWLREILGQIADGQKVAVLVVAFSGDRPIGVAAIIRLDVTIRSPEDRRKRKCRKLHCVMCFVRKSHRRLGIGTRLVGKAHRLHGQQKRLANLSTNPTQLKFFETIPSTRRTKPLDRI